jgi:hypothetical protein
MHFIIIHNYKSGEIRGKEITTKLKGNIFAYPQL